MSRIFAIVGPSGAGKDTLLAALVARRPDLHLVRRVITRPAAAGGEDFEAVSAPEFARRAASGAFALHWQAHGLCYAIPATVRAELAAGRTVLFNGSRGMLAEAAGVFPGLGVIHVTARPEVLARRLATRGRETPVQIAQRLQRATLALPPGVTGIEIDNSGPLEMALDALAQAVQPVSG